MSITREQITVLCIVGAIVVAATGHDGWGWLLIMAFLLYW